MKRIAAVLLLSSSIVVVAACGGSTAERAKDDVKGAGSDLSNGVGTNGKGLDNGVGVSKPDGGSTTDKK